MVNQEIFSKIENSEILNIDSRLGIYTSGETAVARAIEARESLLKLSIYERSILLKAVRATIREKAHQLAILSLEEVKMGNVRDKVNKLNMAADKTPGIEYLKGMESDFYNPYKAILSFIPSTNAAETIANHSIGMIAAGNCVVFCPNPRAIKSSKSIIQMLNRAIINAGGPADLLTMIDAPRRAVVADLLKHPAIELVVATGGPGLSKAALNSGKKAICAGSGNSPVIVDETCNMKQAVESIISSVSFEYNTACLNEKEAFILDSIYDEFLEGMLDNGAYKLDEEQTAKLCELIFIEDPKKGIITNKDLIGQSPKRILEMMGIEADESVRLIIAETNADHPLVMHECLMPVLPLVRAADLDEAIKCAVKAEGGRKHSASIYSNNEEHIRRFKSQMPTTVFSVNQSPLSSFPYCSYTIATFTGHGLVCASDFVKC